jgi:hypothetical protein
MVLPIIFTEAFALDFQDAYNMAIIHEKDSFKIEGILVTIEDAEDTIDYLKLAGIL